MITTKFPVSINQKLITDKIGQITQRSSQLRDKALFTHIFSLIDLTSLNSTDSSARISEMTRMVNGVTEKFPELPNVAAICVYPNFVPVVRQALTDSRVKIAAVAASFPSSQTFLDIKLAEVKKVVSEGADEVDIVISLGEFLEGNYELVSDEIRKIKAIAGNAHLKVILETGAIEDPVLIKTASFLAMDAGADFIKTSSGKLEKGASPEAVWLMCEAIKEYYQATGRVVGIKPAGGISDVNTAIIYYLIVNELLGNDWLKPDRFRFGASKLANLLLGEKYF
ncbi:MAG: deoxyribose-phosphate aldolase [Bacteroidales bacterium]|nr:deoxyribose-phosphate aldolase [Bacteroidales bacterium]